MGSGTKGTGRFGAALALVIVRAERARALVVVALACTLAAGACTGPRPSATPQSTVQAFAAALEAQDLERAYGLMSPEYRQEVSLETFRKRVEQHPSETGSLIDRLKRPVGTSQEQAEVELADGSSLGLTRGAEGWRLQTDLVDFYSQASPRAALKTFVRAVEEQRWEVMLALIPTADRRGMTAEQLGASMGEQLEEVQRTAALLKASLDRPIEVLGERATMPYGDRFAVRFVREDGLWKIEDPE